MPEGKDRRGSGEEPLSWRRPGACLCAPVLQGAAAGCGWTQYRACRKHYVGTGAEEAVITITGAFEHTWANFIAAIRAAVDAGAAYAHERV